MFKSSLFEKDNMKFIESERYDLFKKISIFIFRSSTIFLLGFSIIYFILVPIRGLWTYTVDPIAAIFDLLLGVTVCAVFILIFRCVHTRIGYFLTLINFVFWWVIPCNWIINEWDDLRRFHQGTYFSMWIIFGILAGIALLGLLNIILESARLANEEKSVLFGPWYRRIGTFQDFINKLRLNPLSKVKKQIINDGIKYVFITILIALPGVLPFLNVFTFPVPVTPQDYDITFNFWTHPNMTAEYSQSQQDTYGLGERYYSEDVLDEFEQHEVNLDLTYGHLSGADIASLVEWETRCPSITYRVVIAGNELSKVMIRTVEATELLVEATLNGTLDQWIGFAYDIEGENFKYYSSYENYEQATGMWTALFDYIDAKSAIIGKTIEMECISDAWTSKDAPFDNDNDVQITRGFNSYVPQRFTTYAPMIYRCWYQGEAPWGSEMDPSDPWDTSYEVYSTLYTLYNTVPEGTMGFYIGITNTSCYDRDLEQYEPYSWPVYDANTGEKNLQRDVLIAKHFGMEEITFFLAWTAIENGFAMGGVFDSYGIDFLDTMNQTVNTDPPESFNVFYKHADAEGSEDLKYDWVYDFSRLSGILQLLLVVAIALLYTYYADEILAFFEKQTARIRNRNEPKEEKSA